MGAHQNFSSACIGTQRVRVEPELTLFSAISARARPERAAPVPTVRPYVVARVARPVRLEHVPLVRCTPDEVLEFVRRAAAVPARTSARRPSPLRSSVERRAHDAEMPVGAIGEVHRGRQQRRAGADRQRRRAGRQRGVLAEELDLDAAALDVAVAQQAHDVVALAARRAPRARPSGRAARRSCRASQRRSTNQSNSSGGSICSTTTVSPWPWSTSQRPAHSHPPRCGSARITPLPPSSASVDVLVALDPHAPLDRLAPTGAAAGSSRSSSGCTSRTPPGPLGGVARRRASGRRAGGGARSSPGARRSRSWRRTRATGRRPCAANPGSAAHRERGEPVPAVRSSRVGEPCGSLSSVDAGHALAQRHAGAAPDGAGARGGVARALAPQVDAGLGDRRDRGLLPHLHEALDGGDRDQHEHAPQDPHQRIRRPTAR